MGDEGITSTTERPPFVAKQTGGLCAGTIQTETPELGCVTMILTNSLLYRFPPSLCRFLDQVLGQSLRTLAHDLHTRSIRLTATNMDTTADEAQQ